MWGEYLLYSDSWEILPYMFASIVGVLFVSMFTVLMGIILMVHQVALEQGYVLARRRKRRVVNNPTAANGDDGSAAEPEPTDDPAAGAPPPTGGPEPTPRNEQPTEIMELNEWNRIVMVLVNSNKLYLAIVVFLIVITTLHLAVLMAHEIVKCWKFAMWDAYNDTVKVVASNIAEATMAASGSVTSVDKGSRPAPVKSHE